MRGALATPDLATCFKGGRTRSARTEKLLFAWPNLPSPGQQKRAVTSDIFLQR